MAQNSNGKKSRRNFLTLGLLNRDSLKRLSTENQIQTSPDRPETVPMLTPDGRLVHLSKSVLDNIKKQKATNRDVFDWSDSIKNSNQSNG